MSDKLCKCCSPELSDKVNKVECCIKTIADIATGLNAKIDEYEIPEDVRKLVKQATDKILEEISKT